MIALTRIIQTKDSEMEEKGVYLATQWQYVDLKSINIFYNEKPDPIKDLMQDVKTGILKNYPDFPIKF